jgi:dTDP-4-amino-4,6-dideoxygalactose transaminase
MRSAVTQTVPFVDLVRLHDPMRAEFVAAFNQILDSGRYHSGPQTRALEEEFSGHEGRTGGVACGSGSDALYLALRAYEIGPGDRVATVSNSFMATAESIARTGATVVFVDAHPSTRCMDPADLARLLSEPGAEQLAAIIPVHLYGRGAPIRGLSAALDAAGRSDVRIIGDAAQAHGCPGVGVATELTCYSFYPGKNLGALGDGGMVISDNPELLERIRRLQNHGRASKHAVAEVGVNSRFDEIQAAVLRIKLRQLDEHNRSRRESAALYRELLAETPGLVLPQDSPDHVYHLFCVEVEAGLRDAFEQGLIAAGIGVGMHYPFPVHSMPPYPSARPLTVTEAQCSRVLSLPIFPGMRVDEVRAVCHSVKQVLRGLEESA